MWIENRSAIIAFGNNFFHFPWLGCKSRNKETKYAKAKGIAEKK